MDDGDGSGLGVPRRCARLRVRRQWDARGRNPRRCPDRSSDPGWRRLHRARRAISRRSCSHRDQHRSLCRSGAHRRRHRHPRADRIRVRACGRRRGRGRAFRPIQNALLPAFARTPRELVAANVASSMGEGIGTFVCPLLASVIVASTSSVAASLLVAVTFAGAAAAVTGIRFERAADARGGVGGDRATGFRFADALWVVRRYPGAALVAGDSSCRPSFVGCSSR